MYAKRTPNIFPKDTQKLRNNRPFPLNLNGDDSANILVVKAIVNPKANPYKILIIINMGKVFAKRKEQLTISCMADPIMMSLFLPNLSANLPLMIEPKKIPR